MSRSKNRIALITATIPERANLLTEAVASVATQRRAPDWHLIGNGHGHAAVQRNALAAEAIDLGATHLAFLDDDDLLLPNHLEVLEGLINGHDVAFTPPVIDRIGVTPTFNNPSGVHPCCRPELFSAQSMLKENYVCATALVTTDLWATLGGHRPVACEDWDFYKRALKQRGRKFSWKPIPTWVYRRRRDGPTPYAPFGATRPTGGVYIVMPARDRWDDLTKPALARLVRERVDTIFLIDDHSRPPLKGVARKAFGKKVVVLPNRKGWPNISHSWNLGLQAARKAANGKPFDVCFINSDVAYSRGLISKLSQGLRSDPRIGVAYPRYPSCEKTYPRSGEVTFTEGVFGDGGMSGFCFMVRGELAFQFDEQFRWWSGDKDFERSIRKHGWLSARVNAAEISHEVTGHHGASALHYAERLDPICKADCARYQRKWSGVA